MRFLHPIFPYAPFIVLVIAVLVAIYHIQVYW